MNLDLSCYGPAASAAVALVGDVELRSPMDVHAWTRKEWQAIADTIGFSRPLEAALASQRVVRDRLAATNQAGLDAFSTWLRARKPALTDSHARTQASVLDELHARAGEARWRVTADPTTLASGACFQEGQEHVRAFHPDTAPGYFGDGWPGPPPRAESACGWQTPLVLHLGTFPWVYGTRLTEASGLRWAAADTWPALQGMRHMVDLLQPAGNLRQDARQVAVILEHFVAHTTPLVEHLPVFDPADAVPGRLYLRDGLLHVHQGSLHLVVLAGARGPVAAPAYNYVLRRFACFFAVRRAALRAFATLPREVQEQARRSGDPCLRAQLQEGDRAR